MSPEELKSAMFQVIMTLLVYNHAFDFTHNDLHTNNIMYINTDKQHLIYKYENIYYKVPTFGKIYKIIDFGRSIYKYKGQLCHNDSYSNNNDAEGQYNFEPYFNETKPRLMPNQSFDLCRLGCSMYDNFFDFTFEEEDLGNSESEQLIRMIANWCKDDKGKNVLYKKNGEERYEGFKLYKMIARTVHGCIPKEQIKLALFSNYKMKSMLKINDDMIMINIDNIPSYVN